MVPNGWEEKRLGKVAEFQRGFDLPSAKRLDGNIPIISSSGVSGFHNESKVKAPGIVTGRYGTIGNVFLINEDFWPLNTSLWVKDFHQNEIKFIYYLLQSFDFKKFSDKTGVPGVNRNDLHAVKVKVPPLPEQQKIAKILTTWDKAIDTTERLIDNSKQQKKALMQQLLTGKKRLLDDEGKRFEGEWEEVRLEDHLESFQNGYAFKASHYEETGIPIITMGNIGLDGKFNERLSKVNYWSYDKALERYEVNNGDLLIAMTDVTPDKNLIGRMTIVTTDKTFYLNQRVGLIKPKPTLDKHFLRCLSNDVCWRRYSLAVSASGVQANMSTKDIKNGTIKLPSFKEQQKIAAVLTNADKEIELLEQQLADLQQEKKALMQVLLTGKKRVRIDG